MQGNAERGAANFQAAQMEQNAGQEKATSQRQAIEARREAGIANSAVRARAAASGGGADDPSVLNIEGHNAGVGEYEALTSLYQGDEAARQDLMGASAKRYGGAQARQASVFKAGSTLLSGGKSAWDNGGSSLYDKYGNGGYTPAESNFLNNARTSAGLT